ncbi:MAG: MBL fold metallo-hydrolase [Proteobacteria bacterium]|nr:MBL fold metallo-hydrolase [Pseudomonadota bacterium]
MRLTFLGGVGTVTGSKLLVESAGARILVDCGLFQGFKQLRLRNWAPLPVKPASIDAVVLTHAHLDHSGYLPLLVRNGFSGPVVATDATRDLCAILLPDSGFLQERDAEFANRHGFSRHRPAKPLYSEADARRSLENFAPTPFGPPVKVAGAFEVRFHRAGHILGAAIVEIRGDGHTLVCSGDLGRAGSATMMDPARIERADTLVVESTYGDRRHPAVDAGDALADVINRTAKRGGTVLVPAFAVGRSQELLFLLHGLKAARRIPDLPVFLDSPMAINASETFCRHSADHRLSEPECERTCGVAVYVREVDDSKALDTNPVPKVIVSASGMATGGRVLHHLKHYAPDPKNTILFAGFQAGGTRGAAMTGGAERVKIHGSRVPVRAEVRNLQMLSAHADADGILDWLRGFKSPPRNVFLNHGEPAASDALRVRIADELGWQARLPEYREEVDVQ